MVTGPLMKSFSDLVSVKKNPLKPGVKKRGKKVYFIERGVGLVYAQAVIGIYLQT